MGLLATFKLTGFFQGPNTIAETITLEASEWKCERPSIPWRLTNERTQISYNNDELFFFYDLWLGIYTTGWFSTSYNPNTYIGLWNLTVSVNEGFIQGIQINFSEGYENSLINLPEPSYGNYSNLSLSKVIDCDDPQPQNNTKASLSYTGIDRPVQVSLTRESLLWLFKSPYNYTHTLEISSEITYFNGTVYKKLVKPVCLIIGPDGMMNPEGNNSFETAEEIGFGTHTAYIDGDADPADYYTISLLEGQTVQFALAYPSDLEQSEMGIEMYIYNPSRNQVACLLYQANSSERQIQLSIGVTGYWYVKTDLFVSPYTYLLNVSCVED